MAEHADLLARHRRVMPDWLALYYDEPIELVDGEGRHVVDGEGNRYLDFFGGILTTMTGYNVPEVVEAIREQAGRMIHTSTLYLIEPMIELAEQISAAVGPRPTPRCSSPRRERGQRGGAAAGLDRPPQQPGAGPAQQLPRSLVRHDGHHRQPGLVGVEPEPVQRQLRAQRLPVPQPVPRPTTTTRSSRRAPTTCATSSRRPRPATSPA